MIQIDDLRLAATLAASPSLSAAARTLNVTPPALSMRLRKLEAGLGMVLALRDARQLRLTPEGENFAREAAALLKQIEDLPGRFRIDDGRLTGVLRLAAPFGYGRCRIAPLIGQFSQAHPELQVHLTLGEAPWPERSDVDAIVHIGRLRDSSWVAHKLASNERWLCASPAYLDRHGVPSTPQDLLRHRCICIRENDEDATLWHFHRPAGDQAGRPAARETLRVPQALLTNDGTVARGWAEQGLGLVLRSEWDVAEAVDHGTLVRLLPDWRLDSADVVLLLPSRKGRPARIQALLAFLSQALSGESRR
jgi:DNA-binding transcriptional LysR family regulator